MGQNILNRVEVDGIFWADLILPNILSVCNTSPLPIWLLDNEQEGCIKRL